MRIFGPCCSAQTRIGREGRTRVGALCRIISPCVGMLAIQVLGLRGTDISCSIRGPISPVICTLGSIDFRTCNFHLSRGSSRDKGLLCYSGFSFVAGQSRALLTGGSFHLRASQVLLDARSSVVSVSGVALAPRNRL